MIDLWAHIGGEFTQLTGMISRVLSDTEAERLIGQSLEDYGFRWFDLTQAFRNEPGFPKNLIRLTLASDFTFNP